MKKSKYFIMTAVAIAAAVSSLHAQSPQVRDVDIHITLDPDGSAFIREKWDVTWDGSEWYLVRANMEDESIEDLRVTDEDGRIFINEGTWDTERSREQKSGRCGIVYRNDGGCELCWGVGDASPHVFTVQYKMTRLVKSLDDYDMLHIQAVSPGIRPRPQHISLRIDAPGMELCDSTCAVWAFGYEGQIGFDKGGIITGTDAPFLSDRESMIILARFDKGMFSPLSVRHGSFEQHKQDAFEGSDYQAFLDEEAQQKRETRSAIATIIALILGIIGVKMTYDRKRNKELFGVVKLKDIGYERDIPFDGGLYESRYVLAKSYGFPNEANMASALILKMIKDNLLSVVERGRNKVDITFTPDADLSKLSESECTFYNMMKAAAGSDGILQDREFSKWSKSNANVVDNWVNGLSMTGAKLISDAGYGHGTSLNDKGQAQARRVIGFKKYLKDYTLLDERHTQEVVLWRDFIMFAALYGIADKVAKELMDIDPQAFETYVGYPFNTMSYVINTSARMGNSMTGAVASLHQTSGSVAGSGGHVSFGGGGGFSGGGFGGGGR